MMITYHQAVLLVDKHWYFIKYTGASLVYMKYKRGLWTEIWSMLSCRTLAWVTAGRCKWENAKPAWERRVKMSHITELKQFKRRVESLTLVPVSQWGARPRGSWDQWLDKWLYTVSHTLSRLYTLMQHCIVNHTKVGICDLNIFHSTLIKNVILLK